MRLLFDHNLSPRLTEQLADMSTGNSHVSFHGLEKATDREVWEFVHDNGFTLVTKDSDFHDLSLLRGFPPKVVWLRVGNCTTATIEALNHSSDSRQPGQPRFQVLVRREGGKLSLVFLCLHSVQLQVTVYEKFVSNSLNKRS